MVYVLLRLLSSLRELWSSTIHLFGLPKRSLPYVAPPLIHSHSNIIIGNLGYWIRRNPHSPINTFVPHTPNLRNDMWLLRRFYRISNLPHTRDNIHFRLSYHRTGQNNIRPLSHHSSRDRGKDRRNGVRCYCR